MGRRKGHGRLPKNIHPDPFFADAHRLPFASPNACADLLVCWALSLLFVPSALEPVRNLINLVCELRGED